MLAIECDRAQWQAALTTPSKTLDFGEPRLFSGTTVFANGVSVLANVINGQGSAEGTRVGAVYNSSGSVRGTVNVKLPSPVTALAFDASAGPLNTGFFWNFLTKTGSIITPGGERPGKFSGIISELGDPLLTGLSITSSS